ncbi:hypothetical protein [Rhizobium halophytocola]|uniref:Uncharacterized protein n=1 Tax=Rhizobium halophytocola TaxID=735519 RepID=A0ABS4DVH5_9HYPH|nr:hypothetical protein [Rhizobium halophytocola]MBP1849705.1 hypothetical protein [Rhizobium halophytocola]
MVRLASLILVPAVLLAIGASGRACQTTQDRLSSAKVTEAVAKVRIELPELPEACVAEMERAYPKAGEPWVILQKRWEILAANRDQMSADCKTWWDDYRNRLAAE